jgi:3D (Asp-Asp-Asp) domain-containing protein
VVKVEDVGGAIKDNKLDLYFDSHKTALTWGVRYVDVKVKVSS